MKKTELKDTSNSHKFTSGTFFIKKKDIGNLKDKNLTKGFDADVNAGKKIKLRGNSYFIKEGDLLIKEENLPFYFKTKSYLNEELKDTLKILLIGVEGENGKPVQWPINYTLKYCVFKKSFNNETNYNFAVNNMKRAVKDWENTCGVKFFYDSSLDNNRNIRKIPSGVDFAVSEVDVDGDFIASSFFPDDPEEDRWFNIDRSYYSCGFDKIGVFRHEIGHILGFRHEHIRSGAPPECPGENSNYIIDLTKYDPQSVMHYFCGKPGEEVGSKELKITEFDREGSQKLYGQPIN